MITCCYFRLEDAGYGWHRNSQTDSKRIGKEITIIVLTSYEFNEIEEKAKAAGVDAALLQNRCSRLTATPRGSLLQEKQGIEIIWRSCQNQTTGKRILLVRIMS